MKQRDQIEVRRMITQWGVKVNSLIMQFLSALKIIYHS